LSNEEQTLGEEIDARGIKLLLEDGDFVTNIVVVAEVVKKDGDSFIVSTRSELTSWVTEVGMLTVAASDIP